jgi:hypothetical protein
VEGQYFFSRGMHRGKYRAPRQSSLVKVKRYFDDDPGGLKPTFDEGFFGINIHCGGIHDEINHWSAGCQIIKDGQKGLPWLRVDHLIYEAAPTRADTVPLHIAPRGEFYGLTRKDPTQEMRARSRSNVHYSLCSLIVVWSHPYDLMPIDEACPFLG